MILNILLKICENSMFLKLDSWKFRFWIFRFSYNLERMMGIELFYVFKVRDDGISLGLRRCLILERSIIWYYFVIYL